MLASFTFSVVTCRHLTEEVLLKLVSNIYQRAKSSAFTVIFHDQSTEIIGDFIEINKIFNEEIMQVAEKENIKKFDIKIKIKFM